MVRRFALLLLYPAVAIACMWRLILEPGTIGHNWDAAIPALSFHLADVFASLPYTWEKHYLGGVMGMKLTTLFTVGAYSAPGLAGLDGHVVTKTILFVVLTLSMFSMRSCILRLADMLEIGGDGDARGRVDVAAWIGGLAYGLSPFMFNVITGGAMTQYGTLPLLPMLLWRCVRFAARGFGARDVVVLAVLFALILPSAQNFVIMWAFFGVCLLWWFSLRGMAGGFGVGTLCVLLCAYAFVPLVLTPGGFGGGMAVQDFAAQAEGIPRTSPFMHLALFGAGYNNRDFFLRAHPSQMVFLLASIPLVLIILRALAVDRELRGTRVFMLLFGLWALGVGMAAAGKGILAPFMMWGYEHVPLTHLFRSTQRLMLLPTLFMPIVLALALARWNGRGRMAVIVTFLLLLRGMSFYSGNFGADALEPQRVGAMDNYRVPQEYGLAMQDMQADMRLGRTLLLPLSIAPRFIHAAHQITGEGGCPLAQSNPDPIAFAFPFTPAYPPMRALAGRFYAQADARAVAEMCGAYSVKGVVLRQDVEDIGLDRPDWLENRTLFRPALMEENDLTRTVGGRWCDLFKPREFTPQVRSLSGGLRVEGP
ncbi:hypothetical protein GGQ74_002364 [Desulfobaculum xiamenense]|uniref:4-amino-4-deoxy-L-arabinose transferase n=1 Tax=Desulfobaculum xiamenense TaxID=995050 RepID=A0A846QKN7_9BACT|nr:hypothetical protein [Desulfobaculum xiamenense]NJB68691.1 hypothetical protein [Desulfobaculum xiamenense]